MINELAARGIFEDTITRYKIEAFESKDGRPAIKYPTIGYNGSVLNRVKFLDGNKPKYIWLKKSEDKKPDDIVYYSAGRLLEAIKANDNTLWILNGEASIWAMHAYWTRKHGNATTAAPAIAWFGEGSIPSSLCLDMALWGINRVNMIPDCDVAGFEAALDVYADLNNLSPLELVFYDLPYELGSKKDFNDLWIDAKFDVVEMDKTLASLEILTPETMRAALPVKEPAIVVSTAPQMEIPFRQSAPAYANGTDVDFKGMQWDWIQDVIQALGAPVKHEGNTPRWHCMLGTHADNNPSFTVDYDNVKGDYPRPRCTCGIHNVNNAWDIVAKAVGMPSWIEYRKAHLPEIRQAQPMKAPQMNAIPNAPKRTFRKSTDVLNGLDSLIAGDASAIGNPVVFPFKSMHFLGGLCHYIPAGMLVGVVGGSGEGKTSLVETFVDFWNRGGLDVIFYSPEWTPELIMQRRVQRYSGYNGNQHVTVDDWTALTLWLKERDLGIDEKQRDGRDFKPLVEEYQRVKKYLVNWQGETHIACDDDPTQPLYLETFLEMTADTIADLRRNKRRADIVAVDYLQLADVMEEKRNENVINQVIRKIKQHATVHKYVGFDASQITKASSKAQKNGDAMVTSDDAQFLRSDKFNLMLTINRVFDEQKNPTDFAHLFVDKNSLGRAKRKLLFRTDYPHLRWLDETVKEDE